MPLRLPGQRARAHIARRRDARRTLRQPSGFRIAPADTITQLDRDQWDDVVDGESWFFSRDYLAMLERVPPTVVEPRYALISDAQGPVAAVVLQWAEVDRTRLRPLAKSGGEDDELNDHFAELAATAGARVRFAGLFAGPDDTPQSLLGFIVTLADVDEALGYHIGFAQDDTRGLPLYLRLLHASIADAIAPGARSLSFGRTALEPKARLGAKPQEMQVWLRHRQPVFNQIVRRLVDLARHAEAPETNPFKKT
jgi:hypothetical protein